MFFNLIWYVGGYFSMSLILLFFIKGDKHEVYRPQW